MNDILDRHHLADSGLEDLQSEREDLETSPPRYEIVTYPADFTLEGLVGKYSKQQIKIPGFQRKFVWTLPQASKLIESFLLGLPVPAIFLFTDPKDNTQIVVDGQQRLLSIVYYFEGFFGPEEHGKRTVFALRGLNEKSPYAGKTYEQLIQTDSAACNRLNDSVLRAFVVKQLDPADTTSVYHVFERLNTGGTQLVSQEIRNCIYHGPFNDLLLSLNQDRHWRAIFGKTEDKRQRDVELILRFLALLHDAQEYEKPMKDFLSNFMAHHRSAGTGELDSYGGAFLSTMSRVHEKLGERPFHIKAGLNAAVFDAVCTAFAKHLDGIPGDVDQRYRRLVGSEEFLRRVSSGTTDKDVVTERLAHAERELFP